MMSLGSVPTSEGATELVSGVHASNLTTVRDPQRNLSTRQRDSHTLLRLPRVDSFEQTDTLDWVVLVSIVIASRSSKP